MSEIYNFSIENIHANGERIKLVDSDADLSLFCYDKCDNDDPEFIKQCRGLIYNQDTLIMRAFPYANEYNHEETDALSTVFSDLSSWSFYNSYEGALIRVFYFGNKWYVSTNRKLDAFRSKWSSRESFGEMFAKGLVRETERNPDFLPSLVNTNPIERFKLSLNPSRQYIFLVKNNTENRIVCMPEDPAVYHLGTFIDGKFDPNDSVNLPKPEKVTFDSVDALCEHVGALDYHRYQGVVAFGPDDKQVKVLIKKYQEYFKARGNERSVKFRYLQVRNDPETVQLLRELYPDVILPFEEDFNTIVDVISKNIHKTYIDRFVQKQYATVPKDQYFIVKQCHNWHKEDRIANIVTRAKVREIILSQNATSLNHLYKSEKERLAIE
jgi:hypothetical protein